MIRGEERKSQFKKQSDLEVGRRRREETSTQLRKAKREEQLMKRRQAPQPAPVASAQSEAEEKTIYTKHDIPQLMAVFTSSPVRPDSELLKAVQGFRRMLSVETNPPVHDVLAAGVLKYLAGLLSRNDNPTMVFEAAWALTNIASTDRTADVAGFPGVVTNLVRLLMHGQAQIREQAAWCLGNIAGDSGDLRDLVLRKGALDGLVANLNDPSSMSLLSNTAWAVSNLCRGKPSPPVELIQPAISPLASLLRRDVTAEVVVDAVWALSYLADGENDRIQTIMNTDPDIARALVEKLGDSSLPLLTPTVRTLGNFVTGTDEQTQAVVDAGVINHMLHLLSHSNKNIRKESCWLLSNVAAGSKEQLEAVLKATGLVERIIEIARSDRWEVRKEALWVVSNMLTTGDEFHIKSLVQRDGFAVLTESLDNVQDSKMLLVALEGIEVVLKLGERLNLNYTVIFDEYNGITHVEELQNHENEKVYEKAVELLEAYFGVEDEEDENIAPTMDDGMFSFGMNSAPAKQLFPASAEPEKYAFGESSNAIGQFDFSMEH